MIRNTNQLKIDDSLVTTNTLPIEVGDILTSSLGKLQGQINEISSKIIYELGSVSIIPITQTLSLASANNQSFILPALASVTMGTEYIVKNLTNSGVTLAPAGADLIDGDVVTYLNVQQKAAVSLIATSTTWLLV